jgi:toxin YoeB
MAKRKKADRSTRKLDRVAVLADRFRDNLRYWVATDRATALRVLDLIEATMRDPFRGLGKPEPLRHLGRTIGSRRITQEHRLVYLVLDDRVDFLVCRYHY